MPPDPAAANGKQAVPYGLTLVALPGEAYLERHQGLYGMMTSISTKALPFAA